MKKFLSILLILTMLVATKENTLTYVCSICKKTESVKPDEQEWKNPFVDIKESSYYYTPVLWALNKNITKGTSDTTFEPNKSCNRGEIVTFLYRAYK